MKDRNRQVTAGERAEDGFTLVELLVAISIFCVLMVTIYSSFVSGVSAKNKGERVADLTDTGQDVLRRLSRELANCVPMADYGFWGESDRITFATLDRVGAGRIPGICQVGYYLDGEAGQPARHLRRTSQVIGGAYEEAGVSTACVTELRFRYGYLEGDGSQVVWVDDWPVAPEKKLPLVVGISLKLACEGEAARFSKTMPIPVSRALEVTDETES